jgi:hypothetical protein
MKSKENTNRKRIVWQDITPAKPIVRMPVKKIKRTFKITIPKIYIPIVIKNISKSITRTRQRKIVFVICMLIIATVIAIYVIQRRMQPTTLPTSSTDGINNSMHTSDKLIPGTPTYTPILPAGKTLKDLGGGFIRSDQQPSFIYVDKVGTTQINVSEQPLPDSFKDNPSREVQALANSFNATEKISLGNNTIYIGSYGQGLQRVIFIKNNLLVLITSNGSVTTSQWATYVNSLN